MIPALRHPIESAKYTAKAIIPGLALVYLGNQYKQTKDGRLVDSINYFGDRLKNVIREHYPKIAPSRVETLVQQLDEDIKDILN
jgi:hypothetical protein